jgi:hypothetical protein
LDPFSRSATKHSASVQFGETFQVGERQRKGVPLPFRNRDRREHTLLFSSRVTTALQEDIAIKFG